MSKCLIIFLIIFLTINILPIDFYVDIEKMMKTKNNHFGRFKIFTIFIYFEKH